MIFFFLSSFSVFAFKRSTLIVLKLTRETAGAVWQIHTAGRHDAVSWGQAFHPVQFRANRWCPWRFYGGSLGFQTAVCPTAVFPRRISTIPVNFVKKITRKREKRVEIASGRERTAIILQSASKKQCFRDQTCVSRNCRAIYVHMTISKT